MHIFYKTHFYNYTSDIANIVFGRSTITTRAGREEEDVVRLDNVNDVVIVLVESLLFLSRRPPAPLLTLPAVPSPHLPLPLPIPSPVLHLKILLPDEFFLLQHHVNVTHRNGGICLNYKIYRLEKNLKSFVQSLIQIYI